MQLNELDMKAIESIVKKKIGDSHAFAAMLIAGIMAIIIGGSLLYIGLFTTATIGNSLPVVADSNYNTTVTTVKGNINTSFSVLGIALIVGGFGVIIYTLRTGFMGGGEVR